MIIIIPLIVMISLGVGFALLLLFAHKKLKVAQDQRLEKIINKLPGINCGACGLSGCTAMAEELLKGNDNIYCPIAGEKIMDEIFKILGRQRKEVQIYKAFVRCEANYDERVRIGVYQGPPSCKAAHIFASYQACIYGCLGFGDCAKVCPVRAIEIRNGLPVIDLNKCTGCGRCVKECPRGIIILLEFKYNFLPIVACSNMDKAQEVKKTCKVGCIGCGLCVRVGPQNGFYLEDNLAQVNYQTLKEYQEMGFWQKAVEKCPMNTIKIKTK